jgi:hypothetical protein
VPLRYLASFGVAEAWTVVLVNLPAAAIISISFLHNLEYTDHVLHEPLPLVYLSGLPSPFYNGVSLFPCYRGYTTILPNTHLVEPNWDVLA